MTSEPQNIMRETPLILACKTDHLDLVKYLVECGADVNQSTYEQETPLMMAC